MIGTYVVYFIWALVPLFYLLSLLWAYLERAAGNTHTVRLDDYWKQAGFTALCWAVCVLIDTFILQGRLKSLIEIIVPILFIQLLLFPVVMLIIGSIGGGTKEIQIAKMTHISKRPSNKR